MNAYTRIVFTKTTTEEAIETATLAFDRSLASMTEPIAARTRN